MVLLVPYHPLRSTTVPLYRSLRMTTSGLYRSLRMITSGCGTVDTVPNPLRSTAVPLYRPLRMITSGCGTVDTVPRPLRSTDVLLHRSLRITSGCGTVGTVPPAPEYRCTAVSPSQNDSFGAWHGKRRSSALSLPLCYVTQPAGTGGLGFRTRAQITH